MMLHLKDIEIVRIILSPLIRFFVKHSVSYGQLTDIIKDLYVQAAKETLSKENEKVNASRLSALTGIHRRDIASVLERKPEPEHRYQGSIAARVLAVWENCDAFLTSDGHPKPLSYEGPDCEFHQLVRAVSTNLHPGTILFQLERLEAVKRADEGLIMVSPVAIFKPGTKEAFEQLGADIYDLISAVEENILFPNKMNIAPQLHMTTRFDRIDPQKVPYIRRWLIEEGNKFHARVRRFLSRYDEDLNPKIRPARGPVAEVSVGTFSNTQIITSETLKSLNEGEEFAREDDR